jgi:hypothetical protein
MAIALMPCSSRSSSAGMSCEEDASLPFSVSDPLGYVGSDTNMYRYCANSPTTLTDPSGLDGEPPPGTPGNGYNGLGEWEFATQGAAVQFLRVLLKTDQDGYPANWVEIAQKGCIGLALLRVGWRVDGKPPISPLSYPGAEFYADYGAAQERLKTLQSNNDGKQWVMLAVQVAVEVEPKGLTKKFGTNRIELNKIPVDWSKGADYNWATRFDGYWEHMNVNWETIDPGKPPKVIHSKTLPDMGSQFLTVYEIVERRR